MKFKCRLGYFKNGFLSMFSSNNDIINRKYCPHCCRRISSEEYYDKCTFMIGCHFCRDKEEEIICKNIRKEKYTHEIITKISKKLDKLT